MPDFERGSFVRRGNAITLKAQAACEAELQDIVRFRRRSSLQ